MTEPKREPSRLLVPGLVLANIALAGVAWHYTSLKESGQVHPVPLEVSAVDVLTLTTVVGVIIVGGMAIFGWGNGQRRRF